MRRLVTFPKYHDGKGHPTLPVTHEGALSVDGLSDETHLHAVMDKLCGQNWAFQHTPREFRKVSELGYVPAGIQLHIWAGPYGKTSVHQPSEGSTQPLWRVKSWVPSLNRAEDLVGKTGTVITLDEDPSWPVFEVNGTEDGTEYGPCVQCLEPAHARGRWTVEAVEYSIVGGGITVDDKPVLAPFALLLKEASNG